MPIDTEKCPKNWEWRGLDTATRLAAQTDRSGGEEACWPFLGWTGAKGYGRIRHNGKKCLAHRVAYELAHGPIPDDALVLHSCDNPPCCNPKHLSTGTNAENTQQACARGRKHVFRGDSHPSSKLTEQDMARILRTDMSAQDLALAYGVTTTTIHNIRRGVARKQAA